jgi:hypothetical protein
MKPHSFPSRITSWAISSSQQSFTAAALVRCLTNHLQPQMHVCPHRLARRWSLIAVLYLISLDQRLTSPLRDRALMRLLWRAERRTRARSLSRKPASHRWRTRGGSMNCQRSMLGAVALHHPRCRCGLWLRVRGFVVAELLTAHDAQEMCLLMRMNF